VVAVADALDNLDTAPSMDKVCRFFQTEAGRRFDPQIVQALLDLGPRLEDLLGQYRLETEGALVQ
jgi:response regulator RpfG family c-di-GMP phosphodiesterase